MGSFEVVQRHHASHRIHNAHLIFLESVSSISHYYAHPLLSCLIPNYWLIRCDAVEHECVLHGRRFPCGHQRHQGQRRFEADINWWVCGFICFYQCTCWSRCIEWIYFQSYYLKNWSISWLSSPHLIFLKTILILRHPFLWIPFYFLCSCFLLQCFGSGSSGSRPVSVGAFPTSTYWAAPL